MEITYRTSIFYGEVKEFDDGRWIKEGKGVLMYETGRIYEGSWKNNKRDGIGFEKFENGNVYQGDFMSGRAHGKGVYIWKNGETYEGEWYKGMRQGKGIWKGNNWESYNGEWRRGKAHGFGVHVWSNGDQYDGEWYRSLKHGKGKDIFHNGDTYEGEYRYGRFDGTGVFTWKKGMIYKGQFKAGMRHGKGQWLENANGGGSTYSGDYYRDKKHGIGIYTWPSGNQYRGNYIDDKRNGYGEMYWTDGSFYKGEWKDGIQNGKGKITFSDGLVKEGYFINNMYVDSKNYQQTIEEEDNNEAMNRSVYSHMPRNNFAEIDNRDDSYIDNRATQKRRHSNHDNSGLHGISKTFPRNNHIYHSPEENSSKYRIEMIKEGKNNMSFTAPYKKRIQHRDHSEGALPDIHSRHNIQLIREEFDPNQNQYHSNRNDYYTNQRAWDDYDSDYMGPRKPYMREDRSTSPPDHDPLFRNKHQRSVGIQEVNSKELLPKHKRNKRTHSRGKRGSPNKIKFSDNFMRKYPSLFKGLGRSNVSYFNLVNLCILLAILLMN